jgi:hypothetical protein
MSEAVRTRGYRASRVTKTDVLIGQLTSQNYKVERTKGTRGRWIKGGGPSEPPEYVLPVSGTLTITHPGLPHLVVMKLRGLRHERVIPDLNGYRKQLGEQQRQEGHEKLRQDLQASVAALS